MCIAILHESEHVMCSAHGIQKRASDPLNLQLKIFVSCQEGAYRLATELCPCA